MQIWLAPAKLNLFLHILSRRCDGYHNLQTVFHLLDFGDELQLDVTGDVRIALAEPTAGIPESQDLSVRAARLFQSETGAKKGVRIQIHKRIPVGGGLGGGSSDAATTLIALNRLWRIDLPVSDLARLGRTLGADIPMFIHGHSAWAEGIGDVLTPLDLEQTWYLVVVPAVKVSTANVFSDPELTRNSPAITIRDFHLGLTRNDLEPVVRRRYPEVDRALAWLAEFGDARMTGAGGCIFLKTGTAEKGHKILARIPESLTGFVARGLNVHPLYDSRSGGSNWGVAKR